MIVLIRYKLTILKILKCRKCINYILSYAAIDIFPYSPQNLCIVDLFSTVLEITIAERN